MKILKKHIYFTLFLISLIVSYFEFLIDIPSITLVSTIFINFFLFLYYKTESTKVSKSISLYILLYCLAMVLEEIDNTHFSMFLMMIIYRSILIYYLSKIVKMEHVLFTIKKNLTTLTLTLIVLFIHLCFLSIEGSRNVNFNKWILILDEFLLVVLILLSFILILDTTKKGNIELFISMVLFLLGDIIFEIQIHTGTQLYLTKIIVSLLYTLASLLIVKSNLLKNKHVLLSE